MSENDAQKVEFVSIEQIRVINPRVRDKKKFDQIVQSIASVGLKKPITVSRRSGRNGEQTGFDLVCGQGRLEAFTALGHKEIPALIIEASREDRLLMSLVENIARRMTSPLDLALEIQRLKSLGYTHVAIGTKLGISDNLVGGFLSLLNAGEERLLVAAIMGQLPIHVAIEISRADSTEEQRELLKAYEAKQVTHGSIRVIKRLIHQRKSLGKMRVKSRSNTRTSADGMVLAYRRETQRQKLLIRKAKICDTKLLFVVTALKRLFADENFVTLLRAENMIAMPKYIAQRLKTEASPS